MVPLEMILCPLAVIGITGLYAVWHRAALASLRGPNRVKRERVAYLLWVAAQRS